MLAVSTDRVKKSMPAYRIACEMWHELIPLMLPTLLQLVRYCPLLTKFRSIKLIANS